MRYFISAGEVSGDLHAAALIGAFRSVDEGACFSFLGGDLMAAAAGTAPLVHIRDMAYMGFSEVLRHLPDIRANLRVAIDAVRSRSMRPDAVVLVDYPSFNLKIAREANRLGIPVFYYIPPKVWAWKEWRVKSIRRYCSDVFCILPFEPDFYSRHGMTVAYVGNPSVEEVDAALPSLVAVPSDKPLLALVPGSRMGEIRNNLPVMLEAASMFAGSLTPAIAGAPGIPADFYESLAPGIPVHYDASLGLMSSASVALVTSGTATLECALVGTPQVACYRANGSRISYEIMRRLLKIPYVTLPNLIMGEEIIPEMLLHNCTPDRVAAALATLLPGSRERDVMVGNYARMRTRLGNATPALSAARAIVRRIAPTGTPGVTPT